MTRQNYSPDGRNIAVSGLVETVVWEVATGRMLSQTPLKNLGYSPLQRVAFSPDGRTLPNEGVPRFGSVLIRRTDDLDGRHQRAFHFGVVDPDFVLNVVRQFGLDGYARGSRCPYGLSHAAVAVRAAERRREVVLLVAATPI